jgi:zinc/manganese transport system ATP-binding protein
MSERSSGGPSVANPALSLREASLAFGDRLLWSGLNLDVPAGEFLAVLGANGSGKTTFLRAVLGLQPLSAGTLRINGAPPRRGSPLIGYVPQQRRVDPLTPLRARDVIALGLEGHRWGPGRPSRARRRRVEEAIDAVGAAPFANRPLGLLSGGEQQRIRIGQALAADPRVLLCDEPLLSLDMYHQRMVTALVDRRRRTHGTAVVFVTHEINPILEYADRVLYLAGGRFRIGTVAEVMTSQVLSELYGTPIDVVHAKGRILIVGMPDTPVHEDDHVHDPVSTL